MKWKIFIHSLVILMFCGVKIINCANILVLQPLPARSHFKSFQPLWEELIERGHNVTLVAGHTLSDKFQPNYTLVDLKPHFAELRIEYIAMRTQNRFQNFRFCHDTIQDYCEAILKSAEMQNLINSTEKYDLVVGEMFFLDALFAFGYKFDAQVVAVSPHTLISHYSWILGNPFPASYVPNSFSPMTEKMSLVDRVVNTVYNMFTVFFFEFISVPRSQNLLEKYFHFDPENMPHIKNIMKNISVTFVNSHYSFGYIKPQLPNVVNVAGLHFTPLKALPKSLQKFMDEAEHGVVYLSLGSLIKPDKNLGEIFVKVLEKIPEKVIMKWDPELLSHIPSNILVQKWIPQVEVLNHPKCRLFITHGGLHSLLESLNASVPLVGVPFFTDQRYNLAIVEYYGIGVAMESENIPDELSSKIEEVLHNPKYKENIEKRSQLFRERLTNPLETAVYWVEHVIQHKNTRHLRAASSQLYWYELYSLDVLAIFAVSIWVIVKFMKLVVRKIIQKSGTSFRKEKIMNGRIKYD